MSRLETGSKLNNTTTGSYGQDGNKNTHTHKKQFYE
jgi:hypothetical protein